MLNAECRVRKRRRKSCVKCQRTRKCKRVLRTERRRKMILRNLRRVFRRSAAAREASWSRIHVSDSGVRRRQHTCVPSIGFVQQRGGAKRGEGCPSSSPTSQPASQPAPHHHILVALHNHQHPVPVSSSSRPYDTTATSTGRPVPVRVCVRACVSECAFSKQGRKKRIVFFHTCVLQYNTKKKRI